MEFYFYLLTNDSECVIICIKEGTMYEVKFYRDKNNKSEIIEYLDELNAKGVTSKNERVNRNKILAYIGALEKYGTRIGQPIVKHIEGSIWELRPLANRIFFFYWTDNRFVLLHHFIKKRRKRRSLRLKPRDRN
jgi:phage-related protein